MNGKGDSPRPVNREKYESNFDEIRWNDPSSGDCQVCEIGCRYFEKTGLVCLPREKQQEPESLHIRDKRQAKNQGED
jgi:hypothetical protein